MHGRAVLAGYQHQKVAMHKLKKSESRLITDSRYIDTCPAANRNN